MGKPHYQVIAEDILTRMERGEIQPGDKLPTEDALASAFNTTRTTVRSAYAWLEDRGLVVSRGTAGRYARVDPPWHWGLGDLPGPAAAPRLDAAGLAAETIIAMLPAGGATVWGRPLVEVLDVSPDEEVFLRATVKRQRAEAAALVEAYALADAVTDPAAPVAAFRDRRADADPLEMFAAAGLVPDGFTETAAARVPSVALADRLELRPATPVLHLLRVYRFGGRRLLAVHYALPGGGTVVSRDVAVNG